MFSFSLLALVLFSLIEVNDNACYSISGSIRPQECNRLKELKDN